MKKKNYDRFKFFYDCILKYNIPILNRYVHKKIYDSDFFDAANKAKLLSSNKVAKIIDMNFNFSSILDIGCGMGLYLYEFKKMGKDVLGCDSSECGIRMASQEITIFYADVTKPIILNRKFDLVLCFEVAEHIRKKFSRQLVKNCTHYANSVVFTAAPKGQGGVGHINEQSKNFWISLFMEHEFKYNKDLSRKVREQMRKENTVSWLSNNFMSFFRLKK
jgi:2-polyprenyl-3-methyl-5-hydroxy-6-metoxy-1,4-benzoquinol methylase